MIFVVSDGKDDLFSGKERVSIRLDKTIMVGSTPIKLFTKVSSKPTNELALNDKTASETDKLETKKMTLF